MAKSSTFVQISPQGCLYSSCWSSTNNQCTNYSCKLAPNLHNNSELTKNSSHFPLVSTFSFPTFSIPSCTVSLPQYALPQTNSCILAPTCGFPLALYAIGPPLKFTSCPVWTQLEEEWRNRKGHWTHWGFPCRLPSLGRVTQCLDPTAENQHTVSQRLNGFNSTWQSSCCHVT